MELSGQLTAVGLRALVSFLSDLKKNGRLEVRDDRWTGSIDLLEGRLVAANFADEQGLPALDAIFFALQHGSFEFSTTTHCEQNVLVQPEALEEHLDALDAEVQQLSEVVTSLSAVPGYTESMPDGEIRLKRRSLALLLALDGRRSVADYAGERGLLATLRDLTELVHLGLVSMQTPGSGIDTIPGSVRAPTTRPIGATPTPKTPLADGAAVASPRVNLWHRA